MAARRTWLAAFLFAGCTLMLGWFAVVFIAERAEDGQEGAEPTPLPVAVAPLVRQGEYRVTDAFAGTVEPARKVALAFERAGRVDAVEVDEGDRVQAGRVLAWLDHDALRIEKRRLEAERNAIQSDRALAEATLSRRQQLVDRGVESGARFDAARYEASSIAARLDEVTARLEAVELDLGRSAVLAPFSGTIAERRLDEGAIAAAGAEVLVLQETDRPQARIGVPADLATRLSVGTPVELRHDGRSFRGRVAAVSPQIDPATRTMPVLVDLPVDLSPGRSWPMGTVVRLLLTRTIAASGAWVDLEALVGAERGLWAIMVVQNGPEGPVAARTVVEILHVAGGRAFVRGGFGDDTAVIVTGVHRVVPGQRVEPLPLGE